jgi:group I intron endonuclease
MIIYSVTNLINGKIYVGQTTQSPEKRWKYHCYRGYILTDAITKYGKHNFEFKVIDTANSHDELNKKEIYWINVLNSIAPNGYNLRKGGDSGGLLSEQTKKKISLAQKNKKISDKHKKRLSELNSGKNNPMYGKTPNLGKIYTDEHRSNISNSLKGRKHCKSSIEKIRKKKIGVPLSTKKQYKFIVLNTETNELIGEWSNQQQCARDLKIHAQNINKCLKGLRHLVGIYKFEIKEEK